jgi:hypothetical protein
MLNIRTQAVCAGPGSDLETLSAFCVRRADHSPKRVSSAGAIGNYLLNSMLGSHFALIA